MIREIVNVRASFSWRCKSRFLGNELLDGYQELAEQLFRLHSKNFPRVDHNFFSSFFSPEFGRQEELVDLEQTRKIEK